MNNVRTNRRAARAICVALFALIALLVPAVTSGQSRQTYDDLATLFRDWRAFQKPKLTGGVYDYRTAAMAAQHAALARYKQRLQAIDTTGWRIPQQVDWHIVRAEMNGLDFDHRVLKPWVNNPAFYVTVFWGESDQPAREGPHAEGMVELYRFARPLSARDAAIIDTAVRRIPAFLDQARINLTGNQKDLWMYGIGDVRGQSADLERLARELTPAHSALSASLTRAKDATDAFVRWLESQASSKTGRSGIGVANYNWYLGQVQLLPYTWHDLVRVMEAQLSRSWSFLALEEKRNAALPQLSVIASAEEHTRRFNAAITDYVAFIREHDLLTMKPYMDARLRERIGRFSSGPREFFTEVDYRDPMVMRTHGFHWFDKGEMAEEPHTSMIRRGPLLYNIFNTRTEGFATEWEELMMGAGMFDKSPRSRELVYILVAERAARALGDLHMQSNEFTLEQAAEFTSANTPRGWLSLTGNLVRGEQHLYLQQPGYGISYVVGKVETERTMQTMQRKQGNAFSFRRFMDAYLSAGQIPMSLVRWEVTGELDAELRTTLRGGSR
ncbi:MAG TPA: DUF885 family protein [Gemmatimonadaceae bacterium]|nr:DUF885 family protein [Gemmatimonadaceae bacterium]